MPSPLLHRQKRDYFSDLCASLCKFTNVQKTRTVYKQQIAGPSAGTYMNRIYRSLLILSAVLPFVILPCCAQKPVPGRTTGSAAPSGAARTKTTAPKKVAMIGSMAREAAPELVLMPVAGPQEFDLDASLVYKLKSHQSDPVPSEFNYLAGVLQRSVQNSVKEKLGTGVVRFQDTAAVKDTPSDPIAAAQHTHAKFILSQTI